jgi:hypothetical protein
VPVDDNRVAKLSSVGPNVDAAQSRPPFADSDSAVRWDSTCLEDEPLAVTKWNAYWKLAATERRGPRTRRAALTRGHRMDMLRTAVVDITTLVAASHALKSSPVEGDLGLQRKLRGRLRREIKRGSLAYIDALARTKRSVVDAALLAACRRAAEQQMTHAIAHQHCSARSWRMSLDRWTGSWWRDKTFGASQT